jgi:hypothetical protein
MGYRSDPPPTPANTGLHVVGALYVSPALLALWLVDPKGTNDIGSWLVSTAAGLIYLAIGALKWPGFPFKISRTQSVPDRATRSLFFALSSGLLIILFGTIALPLGFAAAFAAASFFMHAIFVALLGRDRFPPPDPFDFSR